MDRIKTLQQFLVDELAADPSDVERLDVELVEEDIVDSLGIFSIVDFLEAQYSIAIDPTEITIENFSTLRAIDALVERKLKT